MPKKSSTKEFIEKSVNLFGNKYSYDKVYYNGNKNKVIITCNIHKIDFSIRPNDFLRGVSCPKCYREENSKSKYYNNEIFINKSKEIYGDFYNYDKVNYINSHTKVIITCKTHGDFYVRPNSHLNSNYGCKICSKKRYDKKITEKKTKYFIEKCNKIYDGFYDYSLIDLSNDRIKIICPNHGEFYQNYLNHLGGHKCKKCAKDESLIKKLKFTKKQFIVECLKVHDNKYSYEKTEYTKLSDKIIITCPKHKDFCMSAECHYYGQGCKKCFIEKNSQKRRLSIEEFVKRSIEIHGDKYDYSKVEYINTETKVKIFCKKHEYYFYQTPHAHLSNNGCKKCSNNVSKKETLWLDLMKVPKEKRNIFIKINGRRFNIDGFDDKNNVVYEFLGDFWHGNPKKFKLNEINKVCNKTFKELYENTVEKINIIEKAGFKVIYIWESDFNEVIK